MKITVGQQPITQIFVLSDGSIKIILPKWVSNHYSTFQLICIFGIAKGKTQDLGTCVLVISGGT